MPTSSAKPSSQAVFTEGSTMRHVVVMTSTAAIGLMSIFFVDAISLFYISQLGDPAQTAAVGRASYMLGFVLGMSVGVMIGASVLASRAIGAGRDKDARSYAGSSLIAVFVFNVAVTIALFAARDWLLGALNAEGPALTYAQTYLNIVLPGTPFLGIGIVAMGLLRARGDARRAMTITLFGGLLTAVLDPIFIFVLGWEVAGAAFVSFLARVSFAVLGLYYVLVVHKMVDWPSFARLKSDLRQLNQYAVPAVITNLAAPVGMFIIAQKIAEYGDSAIAGQSVVDRLVPLAFGVIFSLSGAIGPIIGQNFGAGKMVRVRRALIDAMIFIAVYVSISWALLFLFRNQIIATYSATGDMALMIDLFCVVAAGAFYFNGILFVTNAAFNNLGKPFWATMFNWARQTIGVLPFIWVGGQLNGLTGIIWGVSIGAVPFGIVSLVTAFRLIKTLSPDAQTAAAPA